MTPPTHIRHLVLAAIACLVAPIAAHAKPAPDIALKSLDGHTQHLRDLRGHIVVLSFWATWCAPCREELPRLSHLSDAYAGKDVRFIAISVDDPKDRPKIQPFLTTQQIHLEVWTGASPDDLGRYKLGDIVPATLILDPAGEPITRISGEATDTDIRSRLDWLLNNRQGPTPEPILTRH